jgi:hypothetical protein
MYKRIIVIAFMLLLTIIIWAAPTDNMGQKEQEPYICNFTDEAIVIDGKLDEDAWQEAGVLTFTVPLSLTKPISHTKGKMLWDDKYLYVGFMAVDQDLMSSFTVHDSPTFKEDVLETFLMPDPETEGYFNFEINALGTVCEEMRPPLKKGEAPRKYNCTGLKVKVSLDGTLNNNKDKDKGWSMEVAFPFAELPLLKGNTPKAGDTWKFHLSRYDYSKYLPDSPELSSTALLTRVNFHYPADWQTLIFQK